MRLLPVLLLLSVFSGYSLAASVAGSASSNCVILLHGLARTANSMEKLGSHLQGQGYLIANVDYPSREKPVEELAELAIAEGLESCRAQLPASRSAADNLKVNFVTHSMGGILVRQYLSTNTLQALARVVMLAPPNQGSEVVDEFKSVPGFEMLNGPAGIQLGTDENSVPKTLGAANFEVGIIAGTRSINLVLSTYLPDPDDGKVSVASARLEGMCGFLTLPVSHPFIMTDEEAIEQVTAFLSTGQFSHKNAEQLDCPAQKP